MPIAVPAAAVAELERATAPARVLTAPEDLMVFEYDATIERGQPTTVVLPETAGDI